MSRDSGREKEDDNRALQQADAQDYDNNNSHGNENKQSHRENELVPVALISVERTRIYPGQLADNYRTPGDHRHTPHSQSQSQSHQQHRPLSSASPSSANRAKSHIQSPFIHTLEDASSSSSRSREAGPADSAGSILRRDNFAIHYDRNGTSNARESGGIEEAGVDGQSQSRSTSNSVVSFIEKREQTRQEREGKLSHSVLQRQPVAQGDRHSDNSHNVSTITRDSHKPDTPVDIHNNPNTSTDGRTTSYRPDQQGHPSTVYLHQDRPNPPSHTLHTTFNSDNSPSQVGVQSPSCDPPQDGSDFQNLIVGPVIDIPSASSTVLRTKLSDTSASPSYTLSFNQKDRPRIVNEVIKTDSVKRVERPISVPDINQRSTPSQIQSLNNHPRHQHHLYLQPSPPYSSVNASSPVNHSSSNLVIDPYLNSLDHYVQAYQATSSSSSPPTPPSQESSGNWNVVEPNLGMSGKEVGLSTRSSEIEKSNGPGPSSYNDPRLYPSHLRSGTELQGVPSNQLAGTSGTTGSDLSINTTGKRADLGPASGFNPSDRSLGGELTPTLSLSGEPLKTKIKPKGRGKRKAEEVVQAEVTTGTGSVPNPNYPHLQREGGGDQDGRLFGPNMQVQINHNYAVGSAPPSYNEYGYPPNHIGGSTYTPGHPFPPPSNQPAYYAQHGNPSSIQSYYDPNGPDQRSSSTSPRTGQSDRAGAIPPYNAMAGPSQPYLQGLPPAIQSQMPGGADYPSLPIGVSGGKIFKCMGFAGCEMTFTRSEHLARHVRKHTGERPFPCHCGKAFSRLDNLRQHAATVHSDSTELNERMLRALAPVHAALSQRAGKEQRQRGEVLSVPKTGGERPKPAPPKKVKRLVKSPLPEWEGLPPQPMMHIPNHPMAPGMTSLPPGIHPGHSAFQIHHPLGEMVPHYGPPIGPGPAGAPLAAMHMSQPPPPPWIPPQHVEHQRPGSAHRPSPDNRPSTSYNPPTGAVPSQSGPHAGFPEHGRPGPDQTNGFQYDPFPHGIRPGSKQPVALQLHYPHRPSISIPAEGTSTSVEGRLPERPTTATSPYLQVPPLSTASNSAAPYVTGFGQIQPSPLVGQHNYPQPSRSAQAPDVYSQPPHTAPSTGRPATGIMQQQQQQLMQPGQYSSSHPSSGASSRRTANSSHSMGPVTHQQIQEIYGNSGATQESPFSYHPPPTASNPPPSGMIGGNNGFTFGNGMGDYPMQQQQHGFYTDAEARKRKVEGYNPDGYEQERRKSQKTDVGKVAAGVFYPGRAERRNSLAISSLLSGDSQTQQPRQNIEAEEYGQGYYAGETGPSVPASQSMENFTFGSVGPTDQPDYSYPPGTGPGGYLTQEQDVHGMEIKPGHHAMDVKARALLGNNGTTGGFEL